MDNGYIKLHRKMKKSKVWYYTHAQFRVWMTILLNVNWNESWCRFDGQERKLKPGEMITSRSHLVEESRTSKSVVRDTLKKLEQDNMISLERSSEGTVLRVLNWGEYQRIAKQGDSEAGSGEGNSRGSEAGSEGGNDEGTHKEYKEIKEENSITSDSSKDESSLEDGGEVNHDQGGAVGGAQEESVGDSEDQIDVKDSGKNDRDEHEEEPITDNPFKDRQKKIVDMLKSLDLDQLDGENLWGIAGRMINNYGARPAIMVIEDLKHSGKLAQERFGDNDNPVRFLMACIKNEHKFSGSGFWDPELIPDDPKENLHANLCDYDCAYPWMADDMETRAKWFQDRKAEQQHGGVN